MTAVSCLRCGELWLVGPNAVSVGRLYGLRVVEATSPCCRTLTLVRGMPVREWRAVRRLLADTAERDLATLRAVLDRPDAAALIGGDRG